jgi:hypothetical protein
MVPLSYLSDDLLSDILMLNYFTSMVHIASRMLGSKSKVYIYGVYPIFL